MASNIVPVVVFCAHYKEAARFVNCEGQVGGGIVKLDVALSHISGVADVWVNFTKEVSELWERTRSRFVAARGEDSEVVLEYPLPENGQGVLPKTPALMKTSTRVFAFFPGEDAKLKVALLRAK